MAKQEPKRSGFDGSWATWKDRLGIIGVIVLMAGMAAGRVFGMLIDGSPNAVMYLYLAAEIIVIILSFASLRAMKQK